MDTGERDDPLQQPSVDHAGWGIPRADEDDYLGEHCVDQPGLPQLRSVAPLQPRAHRPGKKDTALLAMG